MPLVLCILVATGAAAEPSLWKASGAWDVFVDPDVGNGCFAQRIMDNGTTVRFGSVPDRAGGFFAAYNADWTYIEVGATAVVELDFGDVRFAGEAVGEISDGIKGGYVFFDNPAFVDQLRRRYTLDIKVRGEDFSTVDLAGTSAAIASVLACQTEQSHAQTNE